MRTISFTKEALNVTICNLHSGLKLTSPIYCSTNTTYHVSLSQQIDTDNTIEASFGIDSNQDDFKGALLYKLQRKYETGKWLYSSIASIGDTTKSIHLLVVWDVRDDDYRFCVCLIEYADNFTWNEYKLWALCQQYMDRICVNYNCLTIPWLINGGAVIKIGHSITYGSDYKLDIVISEGTGKYKMFKPMKIDPKRLVLPSSV
jgi:hypothetical protein